MSDMTDDKKMESWLDLMDQDVTLTDADIDKKLADDASVDDLMMLLDCRQAMKEKEGHYDLRVDDEWEEFAARHQTSTTASYPSRNEKEKENELEDEAEDEEESNALGILFTRHRQLWLGSLIGIAATLLCLFVFTWMKQKQEDILPAGEVVYEIKDAPRKLTLQNGNDDAFELDPTDASVKQEAPAFVASKNGSMLNYRAIVHNGEPSEPQKLTTPVGKDYTVLLSDGSQVNINADSRLEYPSKFEGKERRVKLQGEAYFSVAKDPAHPFYVETDQMELRVTGTKFNVNTYGGKATRVTLIEGSVWLKNKKNGREATLKPGDEVTVLADGDIAHSTVDVDGYVYWQEGFFYFDNQPLSDIMQSLGCWYNVNIVFQNKEAMKYRLHFLCDRKGSIDHAIHLLNQMKHMQIVHEGNSIVVR